MIEIRTHFKWEWLELLLLTYPEAHDHNSMAKNKEFDLKID